MAMASSYASSRVREVEHRSASACTYETTTVAINNDGWKISAQGENNDFSSVGIPADKMADYAAGGESIMTEGDNINGTKLVKAQSLAPGTTIRVSPMERSSGGWSTDHFSPNLRLPEGITPGKGMVILLESMARECLAIALSPYHDYELGKTYVVHFGANGNLQTVLRRHMNYNECVDITCPSRMCAEDEWIPYWIVLQGGKLSAGVGRVPGKNCVGVLDDAMYDMLRSGVDAVRYVGIGNSALQRNARDLRVRNVTVMGIPTHFGLGGIPIEEGGKFVNIMEIMGKQGAGGGEDANMPTDAELLLEYEKERTKAKARAAKFGIEYKEPAPDAFLKWSEARRLRANPERGFITGIDTFSVSEKAKANARKERFKSEAREERKRKGLDDGDDDDGNMNGDGENDEAMEDDVDDVAEWEKTKKDPLPIEQAWENWKLVKQFRVDPDGKSGNDGDLAKKDGEEEAKEFIPRNVVIVPTKIHIFSIDWAPFKQIRTDDLMAYFRDYGPSYVEWLGELSCNVLFEDKHSAARAFHALSQELPSPPPEPVVNPAANGDGEQPADDAPGRFEAFVDDSKETTMEGTEANEDDDAEKNSMDATTNDGDGNENDTQKQQQQQEKEEPLPNYGEMGWRFCKWTVRKVSNDRYGKRGTRARVLMRLATSIDVLDDRPTEWPKPPPGFTTKRVLMPWHDFSGRRQQRGRKDTKRRRRSDGDRGGGGRRCGRGRGRDDGYVSDDYDREGDHPGLTKGLRSGRSGFSVEELQAERNAKNAEIL
eukprot:CAMPEP_0172308350 /NCGR_PEP_ID=MMETSP1058-20130122/8971_1 /TAXON_ID=83371 /ORGANISM="Detonula confervacea, Strain CCMP 353" /LENGTH=769 /DNA_ID=CAMNT_0013020741 /DNA_START=39 /DNA_END=2345 /DNA_ORIENTATION=+